MMTKQINQEHLNFVEQDRNAFESDIGLYTYRNGTTDENVTMIALRYGMDRDCILLYELGECVANFVQQTYPAPAPRKSVMNFAYDMEGQLKANDHKGGWDEEHWCDLAADIDHHLGLLRKELMKANNAQNGSEITRRCAHIANFAMMIAENKGDRI